MHKEAIQSTDVHYKDFAYVQHDTHTHTVTILCLLIVMTPGSLQSCFYMKWEAVYSDLNRVGQSRMIKQYSLAKSKEANETYFRGY